MSLQWTEHFDGNNNSTWEAQSPYTSDSDPRAVPDIYWGLKQEVQNNEIVWCADHDKELTAASVPVGGGLVAVDTGPWRSLTEAKAAIEAANDAILAELEGER